MKEFIKDENGIKIIEEYLDKDWHSGYPITQTREIYLTNKEIEQLCRMKNKENLINK